MSLYGRHGNILNKDFTDQVSPLKGYDHMYRPSYVKKSADSQYHLLFSYVHDYLQYQIATIGPCYIVCARGMQSLKY